VDFVQNKVGKKQKGIIQTVFCYDLMKVEYQTSTNLHGQNSFFNFTKFVTGAEGA
jgi:hypothetical protein